MIKRYIFNRCDENWAEEPDGDIVLFSDHAADRERMKKIIDEQNQRLAAVIVELGELKKLHDAEITLAELRQETIYSLRACIETAEKQEPDSWRVTSHRCCGTHTTDKEIAEHWMKTGEAYPLYAMPPMPAQQKTYTVKVYNKGGSGEFKRVEGIDALEDGQKLIAIKE
jgi:hypothetical protein